MRRRSGGIVRASLFLLRQREKGAEERLTNGVFTLGVGEKRRRGRIKSRIKIKKMIKSKIRIRIMDRLTVATLR
jgi:hypothetical protein